jgi:hypothetical protein
VQSNILRTDPSANLRVYVVWVPFLQGTRTAINRSVFPDARVTNLWDQHAVSSQWFAGHVAQQPPPTWDYYMLFGPGATWKAAPAPVVSQGGPVIGSSGQLLAAIRPFLR